MASNCPNCGDSRVKVIEVRQRSRGTVYRRLKCLGCGTRRTTYDAKPPNHDKPTPLEPAQIHYILTSRATMTDLATEINLSRQAIAKILRGDIHRNICPEIPRPLDPARLKNRGDCLHWRNGCGLGFPDAIAEGQRFCGFCPAHTRGMVTDC
jgi:hypothetical protein